MTKMTQTSINKENPEQKRLNINQKLSKIQQELKVPKNQWNKFGKFYYRSTGDILEAIKPLLEKYKVAIILEDHLKHVGMAEGTLEDHAGTVEYPLIYIEAIATFIDTETSEKITVTAYAREPWQKKGMDSSQLTGATSTYARKYALNGLLAIDDTKDADYDGEEKHPESGGNSRQDSRPITQPQQRRLFAIADGDVDLIKQVLNRYGYESSKQVTRNDYDAICSEIENKK